MRPSLPLVVASVLAGCLGGGPLEKVHHPADDCGRILTDEDEIALVQAVTQISDLYFGGGLSAEERNAQLAETLSAYEGDPERMGAAKAITAQLAEAAAASWVMPLLLGHLDGDTPDDEDVRILGGLGIEREDSGRYLEEAAERLAPYHRALSDRGVTFRPGDGWDWTSSRLLAQDVRSDPATFTALMLFFSPALAEAVANPDRSEAAFTADLAILPPVRRGLDQGQVTGMRRADWEREVQEWLDAFQIEVEEFLRASKDAARFWTLVSGNATAQKEKDAAYDRMQEIRLHLAEHYGIGTDLHRAILQLSQQALRIDSQNIDAGIAKLDLAMTAVLMAPLIPIALYVAPMAGGLLGPQIALVTARAAAVLALVPFVFAVGNAAIQASIQAHHFGGDWSCWFLDAFLQKGVEALYTAPFLAAIPAAVAAGGAFVGAASGIPALGLTAYGVLDIGVAVGFVAQMGRSGVTGIAECLEGLEHAQQLADEVGSEDLVDAASAEALQRCAEGGLDLAFAVVGAGTMARGAWKAMGTRSTDGALLTLERDGRALPLDYYEKLGVDPSASLPEIRTALVARSEAARAEGRTADLDALGEAYALLSDPVGRVLYDRYRADAGLAPRPPPEPADLDRAAEVLGRAPTEEEAAAIELAHAVGEGELGRDGVRPAAVGNYRPRQLWAKARILRDAGLSWDEIRGLMEASVVGRSAAGLPDVTAADAAHRAITRDLYEGQTISAQPFGANENRNPLLMVTVHNPATGRTREALFKPRAFGDGDGWNRTPMEYVFYEVNRILGMDWVPPAAYRRGFDANFQRWDEGAILYRVPEAQNLIDVRSSDWGVRPDLFLSDARVLDVLLQNPDRHGRNYLIGRHWTDGRRRPVLIDHAASLRHSTDTRLTQNDPFGSGAIQVVRKSTLDALRRLDFHGMKARIGEFVSDGEIRGILSRRDGIVRYFEDLAAHRGRDRVILDARD